jgi:hemoglobin-like flavoprotein
MSLTSEEIKLVQDSWAKVVPIAETAADLFYGKLFELDPNLKSLFTTDIKAQGQKLMTMIGTAVNGLNNLEAIVPAVQELGVRHVEYGVKKEHYGTVAEALLWTLGQGLGDDFTDEVKAAWTKVYTILADVMTEAAGKAESSSDGPLSAEEVKMVQDSWAKVVPIADTAADLFYGRLFELDPDLKPLFKTDIKSQGEKLMTMISTAVNGLTDLDAIVPAVQELGKRHVDYNVKEKDYGTVGEALLWTLGKGLGDDFTDEVKNAWTKVYTLLANVMTEAAKTVPPPSEPKKKGFLARLFGM